MRLLLLALLPAVLLAGCAQADPTNPGATSSTGSDVATTPAAPSSPGPSPTPTAQSTAAPGTVNPTQDPDPSDRGNGASPASASTQAAATDLVITVLPDPAGVPDVWELTCDPTGGSHPDPAGACAFLDAQEAAGSDPFKRTPDAAVCTQQYLGPATAAIAGLWNGVPVMGTYKLTDGCEIGRWNSAEPLLVRSTDSLTETPPPA